MLYVQGQGRHRLPVSLCNMVIIDNQATMTPSHNHDIFTFHLPQIANVVENTVNHMPLADLLPTYFTTQHIR